MLRLPEQTTFEQAAALAATLPAALAAQPGAGPFVIDASALRGYDSATISLLLEARRVAEGAGRTLQVQALPAQLMALAQLYGVAELLGACAAGPAAAPASSSSSSP